MNKKPYNRESLKDSQSSVLQIPLKKIHVGRLQPRKTFLPEDLADLVASVREKGVLQPVLVRPILDGNYELVAGERRFRAAEKAGLAQIPALVRNLSDREALESAVIENIQRVDLNPIELAEGYTRLMVDFSMSQEQVADRVGKDRATVANTIRLLRLPPQVRKALENGSITAGHARPLLSVPGEQVIPIFEDILRLGLTVRDVERICLGDEKKKKGRKSSEKKEKTESETDIYMKDLEEKLTRRRRTRVRLTGDGKVGRIEISYSSDEEFDRLLELLLL